ncbi:MAG: helix-turn-helix domain-containing protein [Dehalococcoidales bacterium]|jgi:DNA-binding NtrC family response regulator|nr:helix-turn-helix domain-containing protein [Candidatus Neomarinimicrobiota bacterium]MDD5220464.1 helix-turn-helix domain-containing protein [Candidatus Bipolaricaulis sp.]
MSKGQISDINLKAMIADVTDKSLTIALARTKGNKTEAAKLLGIGERTIHRLINNRLKNG